MEAPHKPHDVDLHVAVRVEEPEHRLGNEVDALLEGPPADKGDEHRRWVDREAELRLHLQKRRLGLHYGR